MTDIQTRRFRVVENLGWLDRAIRLMVGTVLVAVPLTILTLKAPGLDDGTTVSGWLYAVMLLALYPFWTTTIGWDPLYDLFKVRSCGGSEKNPCGTLPYELDAAVGRHPIPESDIVHSLDTAHHPGEKSRAQRQGRERGAGHDEPRRVATN